MEDLVRSDAEYAATERHYEPEWYPAIRKLMTRIGAGDETAKNEFLRAIHPYLTRSVTRIAANVFGKSNLHIDPQLLQDVTQDVLMKLMEDPSNFTEEIPWKIFGARLQTAVRHRLEAERLHEIKKTRIHQELETQDQPGVPIGNQEDQYRLDAGSNDPLHQLIARERMDNARCAMDRLSDTHRQALWIRLAEGQGKQETARQIGVAESTLTGIHDKAKNSFRFHLNKIENPTPAAPAR